MPKKTETLCDNEWLSLKNLSYPEKDVGGYVYSHETRCDGKIVSILPFKYEEGMIQYLLRSEVTPCWEVDKEVVSSITGGFEEKWGIEGTTVHELKEEGGYTIKKEELISLGTCRGSKSSDTIYHLFAVDLTGKKQGKASGDGSKLEAKAHCFWSADLRDCQDPIAFVSHYRLNQSFVDRLYKN